MSDLSLGGLSDFYHRVMVPSFRPAELMTLEELAGAVSSSEANGWVLIHEGVTVAGLLAQEYLAGEVLLLSYLVVANDWRRKGLGTYLIKTTLSRQPQLVLAEIEDPRFYAFDENLGDPRARIHFYERMGCKLLPIPYTQPSLREGSPRVAKLLLIMIPSGRKPVREIEGDLVTRFLDAYYAACEGPDFLIKSDREFQSLRCRATKTIPLRSLSDLDSAREGPHQG